jgi:hypothetical protein
LPREPRCREYRAEGKTVAASYVDHVEPHLGQWSLFAKYENTQSLCTHHHNAHKKRQEKRRNSTELETDGLAMELQYPFNH